MRVVPLLLGVLMAAVAVGCSHPGSDSSKAKPEERGVPVAIAPAVLGTMTQAVPVTGTLKALREVAINAQVSARVASVSVREGDTVAAGQVLITLDQTTFLSQANQARAAVGVAQAQLQATRKRLEVLELGARSEQREIARSQLAQAEAALRKAQADLDRRRKLYEQGGISREDLDAAQTTYDTAVTARDAARANLELTEKGPRPEEIQAARGDVDAAAAGLRQARAGLPQAEETLGYTVIRSPLTGVVYERDIEPGEIVSPMGATLVSIADLGSIYYQATVSARLAPQVHAGQVVRINVHGDGAHQVEGKVLSLVPVANPSSRDFLARISIPEIKGISRPGIYADGSIVTEQRSGVLVVPKDALVERGGRQVVFVVEAGKAVERAVEVGLTDRTRAEIVSGLRESEKVVVAGAQALRNGDRVMVQQAAG